MMGHFNLNTSKNARGMIATLGSSLIGSFSSAAIKLWHLFKRLKAEESRSQTSTGNKHFPKKLRVLHVIFSLGTGGAEKLLVDYMAASSTSDIDYHVLVVNNVVNTHLLDRLCESRAVIHLIGRDESSRGLRPLMRSIKNCLQIRPQIIHVHSASALYWSLISCPWLWAVKFVETIHDTNISSSFSWHQRLVHRALVRQVVAISDSVLKEYQTSVGRNAVLIYNGIDLNFYRRRGPVGDAKTIEVICIGRLSTEKKGHDTLVDAMAICENKGVEFNLTFVGPESLPYRNIRGRLEEIALARHIKGTVRFLGERFDVPELLAAADIFVLPSRYEGFGLALVEAMASGLAVVASNIDGPREILRCGDDGLLFKAGDAEALAHALMTLCNDKRVRLCFSKRALSRSRAFSIFRMVSETEALYRGLASY